jgi:hypothetical protein
VEGGAQSVPASSTIVVRLRAIDVDAMPIEQTRAEVEFIIARLPGLLEHGTNPDLVDTALRTLRAIGGMDDAG